MRRATQTDVARLANVSQTTVSMVLTGTGADQRRVSEAVRERVLRAIEVTGYAANPVAQRLVGGRTSIVGVYTYESVFPLSAGDFYHPFLEGVEHEAEQAGVDLLMFTSLAARTGRRLVSSGGVGRLRVTDGCVLLGRHSYQEDLAELLRQDFPFAFVGRREADGGPVPYAGADYEIATAQVVERLQKLGHRRIAFVIEPSEHESITDRRNGYRTAMARAGLQALTYEAPQFSSGEFLDELQAAGITAVATSTDLAAPLRRAALDRGWDIPADLSLACLGDPEIPVAEHVEWSGFLIPRREMGAAALRVVLQQLGPNSQRPPEARTQHEAGADQNTADHSEATDESRSRRDELQVLLPCTLTDGATVGPVGGNRRARAMSRSAPSAQPSGPSSTTADHSDDRKA